MCNRLSWLCAEQTGPLPRIWIMSVSIIANIWLSINLLNCMEVELGFCVISKAITCNSAGNTALYWLWSPSLLYRTFGFYIFLLLWTGGLLAIVFGLGERTGFLMSFQFCKLEIAKYWTIISAVGMNILGWELTANFEIILERAKIGNGLVEIIFLESF